MHYEKYIHAVRLLMGDGRSGHLADDMQASLVLDYGTKRWGGTALSSYILNPSPEL